MKRILALLILAAGTMAGAQQPNPSLIPWYSATPPTICSATLPIYVIANGFAGAGNIYGNANTGAGTSCSLLNQTGSGTFVQLSGDATSTPTGGATTVVGLEGVPFCTGFTPTNLQMLQFTTASSPNPCYTASAAGGGTTTNALTAAAIGGAAPNSTFNGASAVTFDYHSFGAQVNLSLIKGTYTDGDWCNYTASGTLLNCNNAVPQPALSLLKGTYTDGDLCSYVASGTLLNCNTAPGGTGTVTDGSGVSTANEAVVSTGTAHVIGYTPYGTGVLTDLGNAVNTTGGHSNIQNCQSVTSNTPTVNWASGNCAVITASGGNVTSITLSNPVSGMDYQLGFCNDGSARVWTLPGTVKQGSTPNYPSECVYKTYAFDGTNYQGTGSSATPTVIYGVERSAPVASLAGGFVCWWDSTAHNMTCNDNASGTNANMVTPLISSTQYVQYIDAAGTQHLGTPSGGSSNACATVGNAADSTDIIGNQSLTTQQFLNTGCAITGGATAGTIDGTHKGIIVRYTFDVSADNSPTWATTFGVCPTANFSAHACSSGYIPLYTFTTSATATTVQRAGGVEFHVTATGTQGKFATFALRNVGNAFGQPPTLTAVQDVSAAVNGGSYTFVLGVTWSATSSNTCNGVGTNGGNCLSTLGGEWLWKN